MTTSVLDENTWNTILWRIRDGECTPFLGAGANSDILPTGGELARQLAKEFKYPFRDSADDLVRVAQFGAVSLDPMMAKKHTVRLLKNRLQEWQQGRDPSQLFKDPKDPLGLLADLPLPIYLTTNYDDLMVLALRSRNKEPRQDFCRWNRFVKEKPSILKSDPDFVPAPSKPLVFHLHGINEVPESLVLTDDDYLDFVINISRDLDLIPPRIREALAGTSLVFIGYRLTDWSFRVLFSSLVGRLEAGLKRKNVTVQLEPKESGEDRRNMQRYLEDYFGSFCKTKFLVYWGTAEKFTAELRERWDAFPK